MNKMPQRLRDRLRRLDMEYLLVRNYNLPGIPPAQMMSIVSREERVTGLYLLMLTMLAGRSTALEQLQSRDTAIGLHHFSDAPELETVTMRFRATKTFTSIGVYSATIVLPIRYTMILRELLLTRHGSQPVFERKTVQNAAKAVKGMGGITAIRRGTLRFLALQGASSEELRSLSRHTDNQTLYGYLGGGMYLKAEADQQMSMSELILQE